MGLATSRPRAETVRAVSSILLIGVIVFGGVLLWSSLAEMATSTQDAFSSLGQVAGARLTGTATPASQVGSPVAIGVAAASPTADTAPAAPTAAPTSTAVPEPSPTPSAEATPAESTATPSPEGRNPWVLLPGPEPGSRIPPGPATIEARGRGEAPIREIRLELDGKTLAAKLEQRSESIWRAYASVDVPPGTHQARAVVVDAQGRSGAYRWSFEAAR